MPSIYFVATDTKRFAARAIRAWTGERYNHASVAFDSRLLWCYSFSPSRDGFVLERASDWPPETTYAAYEAQVTGDGLKRARSFIANVRKRDLSFSFRGLAGFVLNTPLGGPDAMICSEFVERTALAAGLPPSGRDPKMITPGAACARPGARLVASGALRDRFGRGAASLGGELAELGLPLNLLGE